MLLPFLRLTLAASLLISTTALAAEAPNWTLQVDPLTTALGYVHLQVERALTPRWSVYAGPHMRLYDNVFSAERQPFSGHGVEVGVRRFVTGAAPKGTWLQVRGVAAHLMAGDEVDFGGYVSGLGGYTHIFDSGLVLSGGAGAQYVNYTIGSYGARGFFPALHTTFGYAF